MSLLYKYSETALKSLVGLTVTKISQARKALESTDWIKQNMVESRIASGALTTGQNAYDGSGGCVDLFFTASNFDLSIDSSLDWRKRFLYVEGWSVSKGKGDYLPGGPKSFLIGRHLGWKSSVSTTNPHGLGPPFPDRWNWPDREESGDNIHCGTSRVNTRHSYDYSGSEELITVGNPSGINPDEDVQLHGRVWSILYTGDGAKWPIMQIVDNGDGTQSDALVDSTYHWTYLHYEDIYTGGLEGERPIILWVSKETGTSGHLMARRREIQKEGSTVRLPYDRSFDTDVCLKVFFSPHLIA